MENEPTPEEKFNAESPKALVSRLLESGRAEADIVNELVRLDWSEDAAKAFVARAARREVSSPQAGIPSMPESGADHLPRLVVSRLVCLAAILCMWRLDDWMVIALYLLGLAIYQFPRPAVGRRHVPKWIRSLLLVPLVVVFVTLSWPKKTSTSFIPPAFFYGGLGFFAVQVISDIQRNFKAKAK